MRLTDGIPSKTLADPARRTFRIFPLFLSDVPAPPLSN
jgi:hypothetical protein